MQRANILRAAFGVAIAFGLVFDRPAGSERPVVDAADAAAVLEAAIATSESAAVVETVAARPDPCAGGHVQPERNAATSQREL
jgi:hypothetical protein